MKEAWKLAVVVVLAYFLALFVAAYVGLDLLQLRDPHYRITFALVPLVFFVTLLPLIRRGQLPTVSIGLKETQLLPWAILAGVGLWLGSWILANWISAIRAAYSGGPIEYTAAAVNWDCAFPLTDIPRHLQTAVLIPVMEEICFRALVLGIFLQRGRPILGITVSALAFASYHPNIIEAATAGTIFGVMYWRTQQLGLVIAAHITHNFLVAIDEQCLHINWVPTPAWWLVTVAPAILGFGIAFWSIRQLPNQKDGWSKPTGSAPPP